MAQQPAQSAKGLCQCGKIGAPKPLQRHAASCPDYKALYRDDPNSPLLSLTEAYRLSQTTDALERSETDRDDARETRRVGFRAANSIALASARERWHGDGTSFTSTAGAGE